MDFQIVVPKSSSTFSFTIADCTTHHFTSINLTIEKGNQYSNQPLTR